MNIYYCQNILILSRYPVPLIHYRSRPPSPAEHCPHSGHTAGAAQGDPAGHSVRTAPPRLPQSGGGMHSPKVLTINVPLFKKLWDIIFFGGENHFISHFEGHFEGPPQNVPRNGS